MKCLKNENVFLLLKSFSTETVSEHRYGNYFIILLNVQKNTKDTI